MLPPSPMLTIKNWVRSKSALLLAVTLLLAGCSPPGPRALLEGKRLLGQEKYAEAVEQFKTATTLLATNAPASENAQAWNYLGVALHHSGQLPAAEHAYQRAYTLDHDLTEAHFNLGCLWLEQNRLEAAKTEFLAYTLRRGRAPEGFVKLGTVELRLSESGSAAARARALTAAETNFKEALKLSPQDAEALNGLGLVHVARNQGADAARSFNSALQQQPHFAPALLNLAILAQRSLRDPQLARQKYQEYLSLKPAPANAEAVRLALSQLEQELTPPAHPPASATPSLPLADTSRPPASTTHPAPPSRNEPTAPAAKPPPPASASTSNTPPSSGDEVAVKEDTVLKPAQDVPAGAAPSQPSPPNADIDRSALSPSTEGTKEAKRSLFSRLFGSAQPASSRPAPPPAGSSPATPVVANGSVPQAALPAVPAPPGARYPYRTLGKPKTGNHDEAQRAFTRGLVAQSARHWSEAVTAYRTATQADPSFFNAFYNLGLAASEAGDLATALLASEQAVAIHPESADARYNFALALKRASYFSDAANELEKLLAYSPTEARAHLALGNLYSQQFQQPAKARPHYQRVLELDPHNPMGDKIRFWLVGNR